MLYLRFTRAPYGGVFNVLRERHVLRFTRVSRGVL